MVIMKPSESLSYRLHALVYSIDKLASRTLKQQGSINLSQFLVVLCAYQNPGQSQRFAADWLQLSEATVSYMISKLEVSGYVNLKNDTADVRSKQVYVTDKGRQLIERVYPVLERDLTVHFDAVSSGDLAKITQGINKIYESINNKGDNKMTKQLHVVLGGSGAIGQGVINALKAKKLDIRAVERSKKVAGIDTINAGLMDEQQTVKALAGATHVYLCVGIPYQAEAWRRDWPKIMQSVINACAAVDAKLIFLDNVYMYGPSPLPVPFDESTSQDPSSAKGAVRKQIADMLMAADKAGKVKAVIGRSADFFGPGTVNSALYTSFLERILVGKNPQSVSKSGVKHTYANSIDNGRALVQLALDDAAYGQVWHLPVGQPITVDDVMAMINKILGTTHKVSYMPRFMLGILSIFIPVLKEVKEMLYQFDNPYVMSDKKFRAKYPDFVSTSYEEAMRQMIQSFKK